MRLLSSSNLQLKDFPADQIPAYAILSHTWGKDADEVLFSDIEDGGAEDKSSSAELSEAINSMYMWYQRAEVCYAYLADVPTNMGAETLNSSFAGSKWFRRGWTLQELIAPSDLVFFSREWIEVGTKSTLCEALAEITGISVGILTGETGLESTSVAKRMSWASRRETTRTEDIVYCLMGLFDVNMPLLYGEGEKAFIRLQEEIIKYSDDQSLFAWTDPDASAHDHHGLLANKPAHFVKLGNIVPYSEWEPSAPFSISNKGLRMELHLSPYEHDLCVAALDCPVPPDYEGFLGIYLKRVLTGHRQFVRAKPNALCSIAARGSIQTVYVRNFALNLGPQDIYPLHAFQLRKGPIQDDGHELIKVISSPSDKVPAPVLTSQRWAPAGKPYTFKINRGNRRLAGALLLERTDDERLVIMLGSSTNFEVGFDVASISNIENLEEHQRSFNPKTPGTEMVLKNHQVCVNADPQIHHGAKNYMVDIVVEALYDAPNPIDMIRGIIPGLQSQPDERPPNSMVIPSRGIRKFKHSFKSLRIQRHSKAPEDI